MDEKDMPRRQFLAASIGVLLLGAGCGGSKVTPRGGGNAPAVTTRGKVAFNVKWPPLTRATVLERAQSIVVTVKAGDAELGEETFSEDQTLNRPFESVSFSNVPSGPAHVTITAFKDPDGQGNVVGEGIVDIIVVAFETTVATVKLDSVGDPNDGAGDVTIDIEDSDDDPIEPGQKQTLISISFDPAKSRYLRGEKVNIVAYLHSPNQPKDRPIKGATFELFYTWQYLGQGPVNKERIGTFKTGSDGKAIKKWLVPSEGKWNVYVVVEFAGNDNYQAHKADSGYMNIG